MRRKWKFVTALAVSVSALVCGCGASSSGTTETTESAAVATNEDGTVDMDTQEATAQTNAEATLTIGLCQPWDTLNPFSCGISMYDELTVDLIFDRLVYVTSNGEILPRGAKSWEFSDDGLSVTFHLDENATFHDGEPVTAEDWLFSIQTETDPDFVCSDRGQLAIFAGTDDAGTELSENSVGAEVIDDYTIKYTFKDVINQDTFLMTKARYLLVVPKHLLEGIEMKDLAESDFWASPVGSGPCKFVSQVQGSELVLEPNTSYQLGAGQYSQLVVKVVDESNVPTAVMTGDIMVAYPALDIQESQNMIGTDGVNVVKTSSPTQMMYMTINNEKFEDSKFRQALNYAIDKQAICDNLLAGVAVPVESPVSVTSPYYNTDLVTDYNPEKAKELLAEAGWDGSQTLTMAIPGGLREKIAVMIQQNLADVGVNIDIQVMEATTVFSGAADGTWDLSLIGDLCGPDPLSLNYMYNPNVISYSNMVTTEFADLDAEINAEFDDEARAKLINEFQQKSFDEGCYSYLYQAYDYIIENAALQGYTDDYTMWNWCSWKWSVAQ